MTQAEPDRKLTILAVVAHPHDITHMAGTLAHHVERGDSVTAVAMTGGIRTHREKLYDELRKPRAERNMDIVLESGEAYGEEKAHEMVAVCAVFGIEDVRILPFPDEPFRTTPEVIEVLAEILLEVRPHLLLTHAPKTRLQHGYNTMSTDDHPEIGVAAQEAMRKARIPNAETQEVPVRVAAVYYTGVDFPHRESDLYVDITDQAANRMKAEKLFLTQGQTAEFAYKRIQIGAGAFGWCAHTGYAEGWVRAEPQVARHLTITNEDLENAERPKAESIARLATSVSAED